MSYPPQYQNYGQPPPPSVQPPWRAVWDDRDNRYFFENMQTGERSWEFPHQQQNSGYYSNGPPRQEYQEQKHGHNWGGAALGVAAGLAGGALLMHEGEKVKDKWEEDAYRARDDYDDARDRVDYDADRVEDRVEDFPDDAARWAGRQEQRVEDIPDDVERRWDNAVDDVEDAPDRVANWMGRQEGRVENFGDDFQESYNQGRNEERYDDDNRY